MNATPASSDRTFLVPVDFGEPSLAALRTAMELARPLGAQVVIFHAYQLPPYVYAGMPAEVRKRLCEQTADDALKPLNELSERWGARGILREGGGHPAELVLEVAKELGAERIVMGTHGRRGIDRFLVGSVAEAVVRRSPIPVLTVRGDKEDEAKPAADRLVLCAVDLEPSTRDVLALARSFAHETGARLEIVHAQVAPFYVYPTFDPMLARDLDHEMRRAAVHSLDGLVQESGAARHHLVSGASGRAILDLVEELRPSCLVLGTHGRRGASRLFIGSVAEWLLRRCTVPVLTARIPDAATLEENAGSANRPDAAA